MKRTSKQARQYYRHLPRQLVTRQLVSLDYICLVSSFLVSLSAHKLYKYEKIILINHIFTFYCNYD